MHLELCAGINPPACACGTSNAVTHRRPVPLRLVDPPGDTYPPHAHDYDKVIIVVRGSITWMLGVPETPQTIETCAGDRIDLPRGTLHAAEAGPEGVICLEGHIV